MNNNKNSKIKFTKNFPNNWQNLSLLQSLKTILFYPINAIKNVGNQVDKPVINLNSAIESHRISAREILKIEPLNPLTFLSILPFLFGFLQFIQQKYNFSKTPLILEKNIPIFSIPTEKLNWETIEFLNKENEISSVFNGTRIYSADLKIISQSEKKTITNSIVKHPILIGTIPNANFDSSSFLSTNWYYLPSKPINDNLIFNFYYNLDELPKKVQSNFLLNKKLEVTKINSNIQKNPQKNSTNLLTRQIFFQNSDLFKSQKLKFETNKNIKFKIITSKPFGFSVIKDSKNNLLVENNFQEKASTNIFKPRKNLFKQSNFLLTEFQKFFLTTGQIPSLRNQTESNLFSLLKQLNEKQFSNIFVSTASQMQEIRSINQILEDINDLLVQENFFLPRLMSGYLYPDMNTFETRLFLLQKYFSSNEETQNLQINLPVSLAQIQNYSLKNDQPPEIFIETKTIHLKTPDQQNILYQGPAVITKSEEGFDWNLKTEKKIDFRLWLEKYLSNSNPLKDTIINFFGIYESPEYEENGIEKQTENVNYWFTQLPVFRNGVITNTENNFLSFERSFQIPYIVEKDWDVYFKNSTTTNPGFNDINEKEFIEISLPLVETRIPLKTSPTFLFGLTSTSDYNFLGFYPTKSFLQGFFLPENLNYLGEEIFGTQYSSGIYQRFPVTLKSKTTKNLFSEPNIFFYDIWEPLTFRSWLLISQVGFAFLVFQTLKALADNYGKELLVYLLDLVALLGFLDEDLKQEIEILMGQREKGFRIITKTKKSFKDIAGIEKLLPEVIEIVWFLRNSARDFSLSKTLPRGVLLTGPPGTGKTLLVQALAGEACVPVLALSGSSLLEPGESGALKLEILFQEARKLAPCIVFIDEIDTLAQKRQQVLQNPMGADEILESLHGTQNISSKNLDLQDNNHFNGDIKDETNTNENLLAHQDMQREKLRILMQFLVELDGIQGRDGVVVIGATNRPEMLDAAILRPGRFDRIVELGLPGPDKRTEILKLYSQNLGTSQTVSWSYLANRTAGFSAADLASIMNQSSLKAITLNTKHTIETIEHGIDRITTFEIEKPKNISLNQISSIRLSYYQAGKIVLSMLLEHHPPTLMTSLWPRRSNVRALQISANVQKYFFKFARRIELEHRLIGCYAGKAAEILFLQFSKLNSNQINLSDLGIEDIQFAQNLIEFMVQNWYLYTKNTSTQKILNIADNKNSQEYQDSLGKLTFFDKILEKMESRPIARNFEFSEFGDQGSHEFSEIEVPIDQQAQTYFSIPWWQYQVANEFEISTRLFADWYRLYLPDPQETERNLEWSPPDDFYHGNHSLKKVTEALNWNDFENVTRDYQVHSLVLQSFNEAFSILDQHREILDKIAYELLQNEVLREPEIENIFAQFNLSLGKNKDDILLDTEFFNNAITDFNLEKRLLTNSWGINSRREYSRWINISEINK